MIYTLLGALCGGVVGALVMFVVSVIDSTIPRSRVEARAAEWLTRPLPPLDPGPQNVSDLWWGWCYNVQAHALADALTYQGKRDVVAARLAYARASHVGRAIVAYERALEQAIAYHSSEVVAEAEAQGS